MSPWWATAGRARPPSPRRSSSPSGAIPRLGKVEDGSTITDFDPEEARRGISVSLALAPFDHAGHKINLIDTPGYADFVSDVAAALRAADLAVFVVSAVEGVEVQTEIVWRMADELGLPRAIFVNKLDRERGVVLAHARPAQGEVRCRRRAAAAAHRRRSRLPRGRRAARRPSGASTSTARATEGPIPPEMEIEEHSVHDALIEGIVVGDDDLMERYLEDETIPIDELAHALADGVKSGIGVPGAVRERHQARRASTASPRSSRRRASTRAGGRRRPARSPSCSRPSSTRTSAT